jgi:hypothetical protein
MPGDHRLAPHDERVAAFCRERHLATLTTLRADGTPHVVPVGVTFDAAAGLARVITSSTSRKARHVAAAGPTGAPVAVCHVDGRRWLTIEGRAVVATTGQPWPRPNAATPTDTGRHAPIRTGWSSRSP